MTGAPKGCVLSSLLYSLFTHDCMARHDSNTIIKFADDTTVVGLITDNDVTAYREVVRRLKRFGMGPQILKKFYSCTLESILTGCVTGWYCNSSASNREVLQSGRRAQY